MKISIRTKIVALGALISVLTSGAALLLTNFLYRNNGINNVLKSVDNWLSNLDDDYRSDVYGEEYRGQVEATYNYIRGIYDLDPDDPTFTDFKSKKSHFKEKYNWCYPIEGISMHYQTDEERTFRAAYSELIYGLKDAQIATSATNVTVFFIDNDRNRIVYLGDESSYTANIGIEYDLPGSYVENVTARPFLDGQYYNFNFTGADLRGIAVGSTADPDAKIAYIMIQYHFQQVFDNANQLIKNEAITLSITSVVMVAMFFILAHFLVTKNVTKLNKTSKEFTNSLIKNETLDVKDPKIKSNDEISDLSNSFTQMEREIINYVSIVKEETQNRERMNAELAVASKIQLESLPNPNYSDKNVKLNSFIKTAKEVGGDFYDYFYINENQLVITICDVSGKGIPAALFMMKGKELIKSNIKSEIDLQSAIFKANNNLIKNNDENLFITAFIAVIDFEKNTITYVNAGHEKPYILSKGKVIKLEGTSNFVLGGDDNFKFVSESKAFNKGDRIFLFTDGLNEAINEKEEEFSYSRVEEVLKNSINESNEEIISNMNKAQNDFVKTQEVFDDVTMLIVSNGNDRLTLNFDNKDYSSIEKIVDTFNDNFSFIGDQEKSEVGIIIDEVVNNIISYSGVDELVYSVDFEINKNELVITFKDNGVEFNPLNNNKKYLENYHDKIELGGFGVSLVKNLSSKQKYEYIERHNVLKVYKKI